MPDITDPHMDEKAYEAARGRAIDAIGDLWDAWREQGDDRKLPLKQYAIVNQVLDEFRDTFRESEYHYLHMVRACALTMTAAASTNDYRAARNVFRALWALPGVDSHDIWHPLCFEMIALMRDETAEDDTPIRFRLFALCVFNTIRNMPDPDITPQSND